MTYKIKQTQNISRGCMVCGVENDFGLKTRFHVTEENEVIAVFTPRQVHQSYPQITHGGITAAILDETIGRAIMPLTDSLAFGVTIELNVKYKKPVPYDVELKAVGRITRNNGRIFEGTGELYLPDGTVAATAEGKFLKRPLEKFTSAEFIRNHWFTPDDVPEEISIQPEDDHES
ncbi:PaaI family thioesterase [Geothermobacter hydrogeniphilus]|uniref:Acyl-coenzyme A thioesterase THEM4 n=1 Tax=Geothermobacter hydrogeniphilus TaxID=1969733 RepID=A0A1X0Y8M4_9BACT|nr:PaaI family thioesterase [Geothermobacter hydrogeniphilus]ORJ61508.1 thioesterase [Geothermobacter hydrogeniphilus]